MTVEDIRTLEVAAQKELDEVCVRVWAGSIWVNDVRKTTSSLFLRRKMARCPFLCDWVGARAVEICLPLSVRLPVDDKAGCYLYT